MSCTARALTRCSAAGAARPQQQQARPQQAIQAPAPLRQATAGLAAAALLLCPPPAALADAPPPPPSGSGMSISFAPPSVKKGMDDRDDAMEYQCTSMFDCDGDRRDYAKKQWADFVARGGVPERKAGAAAEGEASAQ